MMLFLLFLPTYAYIEQFLVMIRAWGDNDIVILELIVLAYSFISWCAFLPYVDVLRIINIYIEVFQDGLLPFIYSHNCYRCDNMRWVVLVVVDVLGCAAWWSSQPVATIYVISRCYWLSTFSFSSPFPPWVNGVEPWLMGLGMGWRKKGLMVNSSGGPGAER